MLRRYQEYQKTCVWHGPEFLPGTQICKQVRRFDIVICAPAGRKIVSVSRVQDIWGAINQLTTPSITPPCRKGLETRLGRDGLVWAIDNKPLNLQVMPEGSCSRFYVHCANKIGI